MKYLLIILISFFVFSDSNANEFMFYECYHNDDTSPYYTIGPNDQLICPEPPINKHATSEDFDWVVNAQGILTWTQISNLHKHAANDPSCILRMING